MSLLFKEYTVKFEDDGKYYTVSVCVAFPKSHTVVAKTDHPYESMGTVISDFSTTSSHWNDLLEYWLIMLKRKLRQYLVKKCCNKSCESGHCSVGQGARSHIH